MLLGLSWASRHGRVFCGCGRFLALPLLLSRTRHTAFGKLMQCAAQQSGSRCMQRWTSALEARQHDNDARRGCRGHVDAIGDNAVYSRIAVVIVCILLLLLLSSCLDVCKWIIRCIRQTETDVRFAHLSTVCCSLKRVSHLSHCQNNGPPILFNWSMTWLACLVLA